MKTMLLMMLGLFSASAAAQVHSPEIKAHLAPSLATGRSRVRRRPVARPARGM